MKRLFALLLLLSAAGLWAQTAAPLINENNLPSTSTLADTDSVRVIKNGASMKTPASVVRTIRAAQISDATVVGRNWITTATPTSIVFPRVNADGTISYLDADAFLTAIGAGAATNSIREIDGSPDFTFTTLEVTDGTLTDQGGGVARLTIGTGTGGGGTWGSITGTLSSQTDLQVALDAKQPLDSDLTAIAALTTTTFGRSLLTPATSAAALTLLGAQASNSNLDDLADGSLTGSKVGSGINAANITSGTLTLARGGLGVDASAFSNGLYGQIAGATVDIDTVAEFTSALGITGTPSSTTVLRGDLTWGSSPGAISVREEDASPSVSTVTEIRVTNGALTDNGGGSVSLNLAGLGGGGDTTSTVSSSVDSEIVLFSGTTGKLIKPATQTGILNATAGVIGTVTNSAGLAAGLSDETGTGSAVFHNSPTFVSPQLGAASASSITSPIFQSNTADVADSGIVRLANNEAIAWESSPASTDMTLSVDSNEILSYNGIFSAVALQEGGVAVPSATDNLGFFSSTTSAQLGNVLSDEVGSGRVVYDTSATLTTPTISGTLTFNNGYAYADAAMSALAVDTGELANTKTIAVDSVLTFSATPATGAVFGLQLTNSDAAAHVITIPSSKSDAQGGAAITTFTLAPASTIYLKWRHEGSSVYTVWGEPYTINDLVADATPVAGTDYVMTYDASAGTHKKVLLNLLPAGSGDSVSVDSVAVVDPDFTDGGDIDFTATGSPATVTASVKANSVALTTDTTGNYVGDVAAGLGLTASGAAGEAFTKTLAFDTTAALSGDHALSANEAKFGLSGIIFEGSTADNIEGYLVITDPTSSDKTWTLPNRSGTVILSGDTFTGNVTGTLDASGATTLTITGNAVTGSKIAMGSDAQGDILYYDGTDYARLAAGVAGMLLQTNGAGANPSWVDSANTTQTFLNKDLTATSNTLPAEIIVAASDENTPLTTGTPKVTFRMPYAMTVTAVRASLTTSQSAGSLLTADINEAGVSILSTKLTFDNGERTTTTAATPAVISDSALADDAEITVDIDTVGTSGASGLKITLIGTR